jgi:hypothetical protein
MTAEVRAKIGAAIDGELNGNWVSGSWVSNEGRVFVRVPPGERHLHPTIRSDGYIQRYQYNWNNRYPDDPVKRGDIIHHVNEDRTDDRVENLEKLTQSEHARRHGLGRRHTEESKARMRLSQQARHASRPPS